LFIRMLRVFAMRRISRMHVIASLCHSGKFWEQPAWEITHLAPPPPAHNASFNISCVWWKCVIMCVLFIVTFVALRNANGVSIIDCKHENCGFHK
jgi:hypothetical protein